jgi:hypothetical protein
MALKEEQSGSICNIFDIKKVYAAGNILNRAAMCSEE